MNEVVARARLMLVASSILSTSVQLSGSTSHWPELSQIVVDNLDITEYFTPRNKFPENSLTI